MYLCSPRRQRQQQPREEPQQRRRRAQGDHQQPARLRRGQGERQGAPEPDVKGCLLELECFDTHTSREWAVEQVEVVEQWSSVRIFYLSIGDEG